MQYNYVAYTGEMKLVKGTIAAASEAEAEGIIASKGNAVLKLEETRSLSINLRGLMSMGEKMKPEQVIIFSRQLKLLTDAGLDLVSALDMLQRQAGTRLLRNILTGVVADLRKGDKLSVALSRYPKVFPAIYCRTIAVSEQTGEMGMMLEQIAVYLESEIKNKKGLKSVLAYPITVFVLALAVVMLLVNFVLPTFMGLYDTLGATVPALTRMTMSGAHALRVFSPHILVTLGVLTTSYILFSRTQNGKYQIDKLSVTAPMLGMINRLRQLSYCCRTMAVLFKSGLSTTDIMQIIIDSSGNRVIMKALKEVQHDLLSGEGLAAPMAKHKVFLPMMVEMMKVGEETGNLDETLLTVARTLDAEAEEKTKTFQKVLQTTLMIGITSMVGLVVVSMMMAMYGVYGQMG